MTNTIETRLALLPVKASLPFRQLLSVGQITEDVVHAVLDAGEITGDTMKLIGFAAGFMHLRAQGVPVYDVIRMAKEQSRRINLAWGAKRWQEEHDRLSRAEALRRLSGENVRYKVSKYAKHLPKRFSGYLIRTSRRLGMEGLRQRHCVASYDSSLKEGSCAIAAVFIDGQRWTVELGLTKDAAAPLRIAQIKTRFNGFPPASVREKIHEVLGIDIKKSSPSSNNIAAHNYLYMENLRRILPILRRQGVETVTVSFDGGGDSGSIQDISYEPRELRETVMVLPVEHMATSTFHEDGHWRKTVAPEQSTMHEAIDALTNDYLEETGVDWYNNDGGFGELVINVNQGTVSLEVNARYTQSNTEYSATRDIETGEDI